MSYVFYAVNFFADAVTLILGIIALWGLVFRRQELNAVLQLALVTYRNQRLNRVRLTVSRLSHLNYDDKERRPEIRALMGQLSGEMAAIRGEFPELAELATRVEQQCQSGFRRTEPLKRRLLSEIEGMLDKVAFSDGQLNERSAS